MNPPRPSALTVSEVSRSCGKRIASVAIPSGDWMSYRADIPGYDVNQLLLVFEDASSLSLWSEAVHYGPTLYDEAFVLEARINPCSVAPLGLTNPGAPAGFTIAPPLHAFFQGRQIERAELFVELEGSFGDEDVYLPSDSLRIHLGNDVIEFLTEGMAVPPQSLVVRSPALPVYNTAPTGRREWPSSAYAHGHKPTSHDDDV